MLLSCFLNQLMDADNRMPTREKTINNLMDLISVIPDNLIETILMKLPLRDAARTSLLSKRWRDSWVKLPHLILYDKFWQELMENQTYNGRAAKFESILFEILLIHQGPITNFYLEIPELERPPKIDMLVTYVVRNGVQRFTLDNYNGEQNIKLHSSLFTCPTLHSIKLWSCEVFLPSHFERLNNLTMLSLINVTISAQTLERLVSSCPSLHTLRLSLPIDILCLKIISTSLRCFSYFYLSRSQSSLGVNYGQQQQGGILELLGGFPNLEHLEMDNHGVKSLTAGGLLTKLPIGMFHHLKSIDLGCICLEDVVQFSSVLCLIGSSPNLQKLLLYLGRSTVNNNNTMENLQDEEDYTDLTLHHLVDVEIQSVFGGRLELKFVRFLLEKSPSLRKLNIGLDLDTSEIDGLRIIKQMFMFQRVAPNVEVSIRE